MVYNPSWPFAFPKLRLDDGSVASSGGGNRAPGRDSIKFPACPIIFSDRTTTRRFIKPLACGLITPSPSPIARIVIPLARARIALFMALAISRVCTRRRFGVRVYVAYELHRVAVSSREFSLGGGGARNATLIADKTRMAESGLDSGARDASRAVPLPREFRQAALSARSGTQVH